MLPFEFDMPYPSQRAPILADRCVATSQPLAAQAGLEMLRRGGNAVDAAVAAAAALTVVEPTSNGIGSDAFCLIWSGGGLHGLNASGRSPALMTRDRYQGLDEIPSRGWWGVTVPGAVSAWAAAAREFGTMPLADLLEPAVRYATRGFLVSPEVARYWEIGARTFADPAFAEWQRTFLIDGHAPRPGQRFASPDHAHTLEAIGATDGRAFYKGDLAQRIDRAAREQGGLLRASDLAGHAPRWVRPLSIDYRGWRLHEIPPNGQGIAALMALGILRRFDPGPVDSSRSLHLQIEAMKLAFADAHRFVADPDHMDVDPADLLDDAYLRDRAGLIDPDRARDFGHGTPRPGGTVLLTTADDQGTMVSFIQSNYQGFGSGVVVPGTGIALHNRGCCFTLQPGHPNELGPAKLPYHTIIPGFVTREDAPGREVPVMAFGVMGGAMQPQGHIQVLIRMADWRQNPQAALDAPRWRVEAGLRVVIEPGFPASVYDELAALGHRVEVAPRRGATHGRGQVIFRIDGGGYVCGSDLRADGQAVGF